MIDLILVTSEAVDTMLDNGNYMGALTQIFTENMGSPLFFGLIFLGLSATLYIRFQSIIPVAILAILLFGVVRPIIPTNVMGLVLVLMSLAGGVLLYSLFIRRQSR